MDTNLDTNKLKPICQKNLKNYNCVNNIKELLYEIAILEFLCRNVVSIEIAEIHYLFLIFLRAL